MAGHAFVIAEEVFCHGKANILTVWDWSNDVEEIFWCKFNYINLHLYIVKNFNH